MMSYFDQFRAGNVFGPLLHPYIRWRYEARRLADGSFPAELLELPNRLSARRAHVIWIAPLLGVALLVGRFTDGWLHTASGAGAAVVIVAMGYLLWLDAYDGPLARYLGAVSARGAVLDSESDKKAAMATYITMMVVTPVLWGWWGAVFAALAIWRGTLDIRLMVIRRREVLTADGISIMIERLTAGGIVPDAALQSIPAAKAGPAGKFKFASDCVSMLAVSLANLSVVYWTGGSAWLGIALVALVLACYFAPLSIREHQRNLARSKRQLLALEKLDQAG